MKTLTTEEILALVNLSLIKGEEISDVELIEFYNKCHGDDGKFCSGLGSGIVSGRAELRDSDGGVPTKIDLSAIPRGRLGGSLRDPHEGTQTFDGLRGYDKRGKPVPGTDAWLEAHNIPRAAFESRPYVKYEASKKDPALDHAFPKGKYYKDKGRHLFMGTAEDTDPEPQTGGYIMYKHPLPDSPHGEVPPQVRPNVPVVTNKAKRKAKLVEYESLRDRLEALKKSGPEEGSKLLIRDRKQLLKYQQRNLDKALTATPESIKAETTIRLEEARAYKESFKGSDDDLGKEEAEKAYNKAYKEYTNIVGGKDKNGVYRKGLADRPSYKEDMIRDQQLRVQWAEKKLQRAVEDPKGAYERELVTLGGPNKDGIRTDETKGGLVGKAKRAYDETAAKYLFSPKSDGKGPARIDIGNDAQNIKNLKNEDGRIYFAMEGSIKHDALQAAVKKEDPRAAVVNVPSVTLWQQKELPEDVTSEVEWFTQKYGKGKEIILIPDADGVTNNNVMMQAKALKSLLTQNGAKQVYIATPPLKPGTTKQIDPIRLPSGYNDERKGIDDHLGAGRGTLGQLAYQTFVDRPNYDLSWATRGGGNKGKIKMSKGGVANAEKILQAISDIVEDKGVGIIPKKTMAQVAGLKQTQLTTAVSAMNNLAKHDIIKIEWIFDNKASGRGRRVPNPDMTEERLAHLVKTHVLPSPPNFDRLSSDKDIEQSPIITILKPEYLLKASDKKTGPLSTLDTWKPPSSFKGWTSAVTKKPDSTGLAKRQEENHAKFVTKSEIENAKRAATATKAPTAKEKLARKKAPPGERLVRTAEGAKRYGVAIGQPIPFSLTNMVLLSSLMTTDELVEFYNKCHDDEGRFCEGEDGGGSTVSGKFGGTHIRTVGKATFGSIEVDGVKAKAVYEADTNDGQVIRLYDKAGNASQYKEDLLGTEVKMHNLYPLEPPRDIIITKPGHGIDEDTFAIVHGNSPNIYINSEKLGLDVGRYNDGFQMPSAKTGHTDNMEYLMMHEYGHQVDFSEHSTGGYSYQTHPMYHNPAFKESLSTYGRSDPHGIEAYAETFAEWNYTGGKTTNPSAIAMARYEGWPGANELRGSGDVSLTLQYMVHLANESVKVFPEDTENDIFADVSKIDKKSITVVDSLTNPKVVGNFKITQPSQAEITKADKILHEVYMELGLAYPEGVTNV